MKDQKLDYWSLEQARVKTIAEKYDMSEMSVRRKIEQIRNMIGIIFDKTDVNDSPLSVNPYVFAYWRKYGEFILDGIHVPPYTDFSSWR